MADTLAFRYDDMERRPGDPIRAEDWNKAMQAIARLTQAASPASASASAQATGNGTDWVRWSPVSPSPVRAGSVDIGAGLAAVAIDEAFAYVACNGLRVFERASIVSPASLVVRGWVQCPDASDIFLAGGYAYVAAGDLGLAIVHIANPDAPRVEAVLPLGGSLRRVWVAGNAAYVVSYEQGLQIVDIADKRNPTVLARIHVELPNAVVVRDRCAFVASDDSGFCIVDVANPAAPSSLVPYAGTFETGKDICLRGDFAFVSDAPNREVKVFNVSQPAAPVMIWALPTGPDYTPARLAVHSDYLLVASDPAGGQGLHIYDISTPAEPSYVAAINSTARGLAAGERYLYLATAAGALEVYDLHPPKLALPAGSIGIGTAYPQARLEVKGGFTILEQDPWHSAELSENYQEFGEGFTPVQYFRDSLGIVHLRGLLRPNAPIGVLEAGVLFTLPPGYRPEYVENHLAYAGAVIGKIEIFPDGKVFLASDSHTAVGLDGITFRAFA